MTLFCLAAHTTMAQKYNPYLKEWEEADSLLALRQTRSALRKVEAILERAREQNNPPQIYKALCVAARIRFNLNDTTAVQELFSTFEGEIARQSPPVKNLLQSALAELYWSYYQSNRWKFLNRTAVENFDPGDVETWDLRRL
ncbi:MAG: hypothetical protein RMM53_12620, partial [Bacteroidia bacterium]|nr:hypothetical protein [Bacteroidia bacterium]